MKPPSRTLTSVLVMAFSSFCLLGGYEMVRSPSYTLFKQYYGVENLPVVLTFLPFLLAGMVAAYGRLLSWLGPRQTIQTCFVVSSAVICGSYFSLKAGFTPAAWPLIIFREVYVVIIIEQYWSYINSVLKEKEAKKYNGLILALSTLGQVGGALITHRFAELWGTSQLVLIGGLLCLPAAFLADLAFRIRPLLESHREKKVDERGQTDHMGIKILAKSPLLRVILCMIVLSQVYSTVVGLNFQTALQEYIPELDRQTAFSGLIFSYISGASFLFQLLLVPLALRFLPNVMIQLSIPLVHLAGLIVAFVYPSLYSACAIFIIFKTFDYSIFRAAKEILYMPLSFDARYRAKELIDVFFFRFAKGGTSLGISMFNKLVAPIAAGGFIAVGFTANLLWLLAILGYFGKDLIFFRKQPKEEKVQ